MSSSNAAVLRRSASVLAFGLTALGAMGVASAQEAGAAVSTAAAPASGGIAGTDHAKVVNHLGFTYLGVQGVSLATVGQNGELGATQLAAPTIGVRYWLNEGMAIDAGIGLHYSSGSSEVKNGGQTTTTEDPSRLGAVVHVGVPIVLGTPGKHYKFLVIPEANVGFATSTVKDTPAQGQAAGPDTELSGFLLNAGARLGTEIQFGFIGIPELALQGSVGLGFEFSSVKGKRDQFEASRSSTTIQTTVQSAPWGLFTNSVAAIYYF